MDSYINKHEKIMINKILSSENEKCYNNHEK